MKDFGRKYQDSNAHDQNLSVFVDGFVWVEKRNDKKINK